MSESKRHSINISFTDEFEGVPINVLVKQKLDDDRKTIKNKYAVNNNLSALTVELWRLFLRGSLDNML